jgi:hypothetical protein
VAVSRCRRPIGGQADVELGGLQLLRALGDHGFERLASLVGGLADAPALLRRELRDAAQEVGQLGLAPQEADAQVLERGGRRRPGDRRLGVGAQAVDALDHRGGTLVHS